MMDQAMTKTDTHLVEAQVHLRRGEPDQALARLDVFAREHPDQRDWPSAQFLRGRALVEAQRIDEALELLERLTREYPDDARAHHLLARACMTAGRSEQAMEHWRRVLKLAPSDAAAARTMAGLLHTTGRGGQAEAIYSRLLEDNPDDASLWRQAGQAADELGQDAQAVQRLTRAAQDGDVEALRSLALAHMHAGRFVEAGGAWWRAARSTSDVEAWVGLAICATIANRSGPAKRAAAKLESLDISQRNRIVAQLWPHAVMGRAIAAMRGASLARSASLSLTQLLQRSSRILKRHVQTHGDRADAQFHLAQCQAALSHTQGASEAVQAALAINPRYLQALKLSGQLNAPALRRAA